MKKIIFLASLLAVLGLLIWNFWKESPNRSLKARNVMETAMQIVREDKPTPPQSSRFYAIVATEYYNTLSTDDFEKTYKNSLEDFSTSSQRTLLQEIVNEDNANSAGFVMKKGNEFWDETPGWTETNKKPFSPQAVKLSTFVVDNTFTYQVPPPPVYGSEEFKRGLDEVKAAAERRTPEQGAIINFWGGVPGTEAPAGIWQNRLFTLTKDKQLSNREYAYAQMVLAQSLADSFHECWKTKFVYQTKRPDMTDNTIPLAMANPPFPSYVSGHSTISFTAAVVLAKLFPELEGQVMSDATAAKNSRLHAGIHFPYDNDEGEKLGRAVGEFIVAKLHVAEIK